MRIGFIRGGSIKNVAMNDLDHIFAAYLKASAEFEKLKLNASCENNAMQINEIDCQMRVNELAYFILFWGQVEKSINAVCLRRLPSKKLARLGFKNRAEIALGSRSNADWETLIFYYSLRNRIAHGELLAERLNISNIFGELYKVIAHL